MNRLYLYFVSLFASISAVSAEPFLAKSTFIDSISENIRIIVGWITGLDAASIETGNILFYGLAVIVSLSIIFFLIIQKVYDIDAKYEGLVYLLSFIVAATILKLTGITVDILDILGTSAWLFTGVLTIYLVYSGWSLMRKKFGDVHVENITGHAERLADRQDARTSKQGTAVERRELGRAAAEVGAGMISGKNNLKKSIGKLASANGYFDAKKHVDAITKSILKAKAHYEEGQIVSLLTNISAAIASIAPGTVEQQTDNAAVRSKAIPGLMLNSSAYDTPARRTALSVVYTGAGIGALNNYLTKLYTEYASILPIITAYDAAKTAITLEKTNLTGHIASGDVEASIRTLRELSNKLNDAISAETSVRTRMLKVKNDLNHAYTPASTAATTFDPVKALEFQKFHNSAKDGVDVY